MRTIILLAAILTGCEQQDIGTEAKSSASLEGGTFCIPNTYKGILINCTKEPHKSQGSSWVQNTYCTTGDKELDLAVASEACPKTASDGTRVGCGLSSADTVEVKETCVEEVDKDNGQTYYHCMVFQYKQNVVAERCD